MVREKFAKKDVSKVNEKIAIEIKAYGEKEFYIYILIDDGKVTDSLTCGENSCSEACGEYYCLFNFFHYWYLSLF